MDSKVRLFLKLRSKNKLYENIDSTFNINLYFFALCIDEVHPKLL